LQRSKVEGSAPEINFKIVLDRQKIAEETLRLDQGIAKAVFTIQSPQLW